MFVVLKIEIKNSYRGNLEYIQEDIIGATESLDEAKTILNDDVTKTLENDYFNKRIYYREASALLTNGGTVYLKYKIKKV